MPENGPKEPIVVSAEAVAAVLSYAGDLSAMRGMLEASAETLAGDPRPRSHDREVAAIMLRVASDEEELRAYAAAVREEGQVQQAAARTAAGVPQTVTAPKTLASFVMAAPKVVKALTRGTQPG